MGTLLKPTALREFFVNYVQKTPEQENTSENIEKDYIVLNSMEVQK